MISPIEPAPAASTDPRVESILDLVAREAKISRDRLRLDACTDDLGIGSLDLTLVLFEIESHFGIEIPFAPDPPADKSMTVGLLVDHVLTILDAPARKSVGHS